ncbi:hypothetical protein MLD38_032741 [Melastoma candidum]|uniref:Uncharacterized protein n=1 Tax=Melastoma candidum TaxID=119954 RepID=A0ACB9M545_9MYRT|nr:hypothetical protein MLD38_032741 [Melastoma candidum]
MVGMPLWSDQPTNAKFLEVVWKVGVRAQKGEHGFVARHEVEACINRVMNGERSEEFKINAKKLRDLAKSTIGKGGISDRNINEFIANIGNVKGEP